MQCPTNESYNVPFYRKVLLDSGANEVIRPYNHQWWVNMKHGNSKGTLVNMKIVGNTSREAMMTEHGE
eukprot:5412125-Lingulodinium_polyedra.AAC.1